jgi:hypothetical protein
VAANLKAGECSRPADLRFFVGLDYGKNDRAAQENQPPENRRECEGKQKVAKAVAQT